MKSRRGISIVLLLILMLILLLGAAGFYYFYNKSKYVPVPQYLPTPTSTATPVSSTEPVMEKSDIPEGWLTYTNTKYGFQISYPSNFKALDDADNLYGWPDAVVLFYAGGQSYDLPVEVWNTEAEYKAKYATQLDQVIVKKVGGKFITLLNNNNTPEVNQIILTFKEL